MYIPLNVARRDKPKNRDESSICVLTDDLECLLEEPFHISIWWGWYGAHNMHLVPLLLVNWDPLLVTTCSGKPYVANRCRNIPLVFGTLLATYGCFECASTMTKNDVPRNGPEKSRWILWLGWPTHGVWWGWCRCIFVLLAGSVWHHNMFNVLIHA
jgi:hypothetical protein